MDNKTTTRKAGGRRTRSKDEEIQKRIGKLLDAFEKQAGGENFKISVAEYLKLLQIRKEIEEQKPRQVEVKWVDTLPETDSSKT